MEIFTKTLDDSLIRCDSQTFSLGNHNGHDFFLEDAGLSSCLALLVAVDGKVVLGFPGDLVFFSGILSAQSLRYRSRNQLTLYTAF